MVGLNFNTYSFFFLDLPDTVTLLFPSYKCFVSNQIISVINELRAFHTRHIHIPTYWVLTWVFPLIILKNILIYYEVYFEPFDSERGKRYALNTRGTKVLKCKVDIPKLEVHFEILFNSKLQELINFGCSWLNKYVFVYATVVIFAKASKLL